MVLRFRVQGFVWSMSQGTQVAEFRVLYVCIYCIICIYVYIYIYICCCKCYSQCTRALKLHNFVYYMYIYIYIVLYVYKYMLSYILQPMYQGTQVAECRVLYVYMCVYFRMMYTIIYIYTYYYICWLTNSHQIQYNNIHIHCEIQ